MFIRKKKINGIEYAYLVKNKWIKEKGSRQKAKYLGKILKFDNVVNIDFGKHIQEKYNMNVNSFILNHSKSDIINEIVILELKKKGFNIGEVEIITQIENYGDTKRTVKQKNKIIAMTNNEFYYKDRKLLKKKNHKETIIEMNEGFLCSFALNKIINAKLIGYDDREKAIGFAKLILEAGIKIEGDLFVLLYSKWNK
jgi:hypothetical protein